jgi:hypothetical protein
MCKTFFLTTGHLARCDGLWYEPGILLAVGKRDSVELFTAREGKPQSSRHLQLPAARPSPAARRPARRRQGLE